MNQGSGYAQVNNGDEEESISFIPSGVQAAASSVPSYSNSTSTSMMMNSMAHDNSQNNQHHLMYSIDGTDSTNISHPLNMSTAMASQNTNQTQSNGEYQIDVITAVPVPNTIRPPRVVKSDHPGVTMVKRLLILLSGLFIAYLSFIDSIILWGINSWHKWEFTIAACFCFLATFFLVMGSIVGAYKGQWRFIAPGIVLFYAASFVVRNL